MSKGDNPLVSVIVPVYNVEKYLEECIESIVGQTYKNLEVILVDDGSTDNSGKICDEYARIDERVVVVHKENGGVSSARNLGMSRAHGEYLMFVDADDFISLDAIDKFVSGLGSVRHDVMLANIIEYHTSGYTNQVSVEHVVKEKMPFKLRNTTKDSIYEMFTRLNSPYNKLYRLEFLTENKLEFPQDLRIAEDFNFIVKVFLKAKSLAYLDEWLYNYRQDFDNNSSATGSVDSSKSLDFGKSLKDIHDFIEKGGYSSNKLNSALRMAVVDHSLYALNITEKNLALNKDVFNYLHDDLLVFFGITEKDCNYPPHAKRLVAILSGDYEAYLFNKLSEYRVYSGELVHDVYSLKRKLEDRDEKVAELTNRVEYLNSLKGMIRTPLGKAKRLVEETAKKIIR